MKVHHDLNSLPEFNNAVVTIGSFDGVHKGHQEIIEQVKQLAQRYQGESVLITFHPHPRAIVYPKDNSLRLITTIDEKIELIGRYGVDHLIVVPFTVEFSQLNADEYIEKFLVGRFHPRCIVIGYDHRFGLSRQGDINYLRWHGERFAYEVVEIEKQVLEDVTVSSTKIRKALETGDVKGAARFLGHFFPLSGKVAEGQKIGRTIGFPTANLEVGEKHKLIPPDGIYAVYVYVNGQQYRGMLYIGTRPTLKEFNNRTIEVNIFDFDADIYGQTVLLELVDFLREDQKFSGLEALTQQLAKDKIAAEAAILDAPQWGPIILSGAAPKVAVVVLNYNGRNYLEQFLPFLLQSTYPNYEIIIADNASTDDSLVFLESYYPQLRTIELTENHGFAEGYNQALQQVTDAAYYVLLNSDIEVTPNWIEPIIQLMEADTSIAAAQPKILSHQEKALFEYAGAAGGWLDELGYPFCRGRVFDVTETDEGQYDTTQEIFWATGAALFVRAPLFHAIGGFDGDYFAHAEEIDLCWRLKRAGYKVIARPQSKVYHVGGGTLAYNTPRKTFLNFRNTLITLVKNESIGRLLWLIPARLILDGFAGALFLSQGRTDHVSAIVKAHWSFFGQWKNIWAKRKQYADLVGKTRVAPLENTSGRYAGSVVMAYYGRRRRRFAELKGQNGS
jgi:riboflavin kinase/FMN adenylyltransferase